jgi:tetratricopeptide (TPR) repeat protein
MQSPAGFGISEAAGVANPQQLFVAAGQALAGGNAAETVRLLDALKRQTAPNASVAHMRAIALRRLGRLAESEREFEGARRLAPHDAELASNYANLLSQIGKNDAALALYDAALAARPAYRDALFNKALLLQKIGHPEQALPLLERLCSASPADARAQSARGAALLTLFRHADSAAAFDSALQSQGDLPSALRGRAQVALERGEPIAVPLFRRAAAADPRNLASLQGLAEALEADGEPEGIDLLGRELAARPEWVEGHALLARMRAEAGEADYLSHFEAAVAARPQDRALRTALARAYAAAERWEAALDALEGLPGDPELRVARAHYLSEAGDPRRRSGGWRGSRSTPALLC